MSYNSYLERNYYSPPTQLVYGVRTVQTEPRELYVTAGQPYQTPQYVLRPSYNAGYNQTVGVSTTTSPYYTKINNPPAEARYNTQPNRVSAAAGYGVNHMPKQESNIHRVPDYREYNSISEQGNAREKLHSREQNIMREPNIMREQADTRTKVYNAVTPKTENFYAAPMQSALPEDRNRLNRTAYSPSGGIARDPFGNYDVSHNFANYGMQQAQKGSQLKDRNTYFLPDNAAPEQKSIKERTSFVKQIPVERVQAASTLKHTRGDVSTPPAVSRMKNFDNESNNFSDLFQNEKNAPLTYVQSGDFQRNAGNYPLEKRQREPYLNTTGGRIASFPKLQMTNVQVNQLSSSPNKKSKLEESDLGKNLVEIQDYYSETSLQKASHLYQSVESLSTSDKKISHTDQKKDKLSISNYSFYSDNRSQTPKADKKGGPNDSKTYESLKRNNKLREKNKFLLSIQDISDDFALYLRKKFRGFSDRQGCACDSNLKNKETCSRAYKWLCTQYDSADHESLKKIYEHLQEKVEFDEACYIQIQKDLPRTFPNHEFFKENNEGFKSLEKVLLTFSKYEPQIGYVQGMNFIAANFVYHAEEYVAFWLLVLFFERFELRDIYLPDLPGLSKHSQIVDFLILTHLPDLYKHFVEFNISVQMFCSPWIFSLYSVMIPIDEMRLFFDELLVTGWTFFYQIIIMFLKMNKEKLMVDDSTEILMTLTGNNYQTQNRAHQEGRKIDWRRLFRKAKRIEIDSDFINEMLDNFDQEKKLFKIK